MVLKLPNVGILYQMWVSGLVYWHITCIISDIFQSQGWSSFNGMEGSGSQKDLSMVY